MSGDTINDLATLGQLYGKPAAPSVFKEVSYIHPAYRPFIEAAPFAALSTVGPDGMDVSPRGDPAGLSISKTRKPCCCRIGAAITASTACAISCTTTGWRCCC